MFCFMRKSIQVCIAHTDRYIQVHTFIDEYSAFQYICI